MKAATILSVVALLSAGIAYAAPAAAPAGYDVEAVDYEIKARDVEIEARDFEDEVEDFEVDDEDVGLKERAVKNLPGLNAVQSSHARAIIAVVKSRKLGKQGCYAAMATGLVESSMLVYANRNVPASLKIKHDAVGSDHDSLGIFQQRKLYYPNIAADMDPARSAGQFFNEMVKVKGWKTMDVGKLCQAVQRSAFPGRYDQHLPQAKKICAADGF